MKGCELCPNQIRGGDICDECLNRMNTQHPVICATCREKLGKGYSVVWIDRVILEPEDQAILGKADKEGHVGVYIKDTCQDCNKLSVSVTNPQQGIA